MMRSLVVLITLLTLSCGAGPNPSAYIDKEVDKIIEQWNSLTGIAFRGSIIFASDKNFIGDAVAYCERYGFNDKNSTISLKYSYFSKLPDRSRQAILFHELGHCVLLRDHDNRRTGDWCAASFMHSEVISPACLDKHWEAYLSEFNVR
jgi:hypothetical protein